MVDFQSRNTQRGDGDDEESDGDGDATSERGSDGGEHDDEHTHDHEDGHGHTHDHDGHHAHDVSSVSVGVVTVSSSREEDDDPSGDAVVSLVEDDGHEVTSRELVPDDFDRVQGVVDRLVRRDDVEAVVTTGGTGVTPDDVTVEAVRPLFDKRLPGFGELFRRLSYDDVGTRVVGTRAEAGVAGGVPVFCLPGSEDAVRLGVADVLLPELSHLVGLAHRDDAPSDPGEVPDETDAEDANADGESEANDENGDGERDGNGADDEGDGSAGA